MPRIKQILALVLILFSFIACKKENKKAIFTVIIDDIVHVSSSEVDINVSYDIDGDIQYYEGGVILSTNPDFSGETIQLSGENYQTQSTVYNFENLFGNTTYYAKAYLHTNGIGQSSIIYSEVKTFSTDQTPHAPCNTIADEMEIDLYPSAFSMNSLVMEDWSDHVRFKSQFDQGSIEFRFAEIPQSGIYESNITWTSLGQFECTPVANIQMSWNCVYESIGFNEVHVVNHGDGNIEISFCDLTLGTNGGCANNLTFTGQLTTN